MIHAHVLRQGDIASPQLLCTEHAAPVSREPPCLKVGKGRWDPGASAGFIVLVSGEAWKEALFRAVWLQRLYESSLRGTVVALSRPGDWSGTLVFPRD